MPTISIRQWWRRAVRTGHAYVEGAVLHGRSPGRHNVRPVLSAAFWGLLMPPAIAGSAVVAVAWNPWAWIAAGLMIAVVVITLMVRFLRRYPMANEGGINESK